MRSRQLLSLRGLRLLAALVGGAAGIGLGLPPAILQGAFALATRDAGRAAPDARAAPTARAAPDAPPALSVAIVAQREVAPGLWRPVPTDALRSGDRVSVRVRPERRGHVYVFLESPRGLQRPWPPGLGDGAARLEARETLLLPARDRWYVLGPDPVRLVVLALPRPDPRLGGPDPLAWRDGLSAVPPTPPEPEGPWLAARLLDGRTVPVQAHLARGTGPVRLDREISPRAPAPAAPAPPRTPPAPPAG